VDALSDPALCRTGANTRPSPGLVSLLPPSRALPRTRREGCRCAVGGTGIRLQSSDLRPSSWTGSLLASPVVGTGGTSVSGWATPEWHYPALFLHLHGDVQEAVQMEICKPEREINRSLNMISQGSGEVSGGGFSPGGPGGAAGQDYIIALCYLASLTCEIKSSVPCSRDTMNSRNRLVKRIKPQCS